MTDKLPLKVFLDDERETPEGWRRTYSVEETIELLKAERVDVLSLDHDLNESHYARDYSDGKTGYDVLLWLVERVSEDPTMHVPVIRLHTMNPEGRARMLGVAQRIEEIKHRGE